MILLYHFNLSLFICNLRRPTNAKNIATTIKTVSPFSMSQTVDPTRSPRASSTITSTNIVPILLANAKILVPIEAIQALIIM